MFVARITGPYFVLFTSDPAHVPVYSSVWWSCKTASCVVVSESKSYVIVHGSFGDRYATVEMKRALANYAINVRVEKGEQTSV